MEGRLRRIARGNIVLGGLNLNLLEPRSFLPPQRIVFSFGNDSCEFVLLGRSSILELGMFPFLLISLSHFIPSPLVLLFIISLSHALVFPFICP
jgi:hypothetical protein